MLLTSPLLSAPHGFTTRLGGVSAPPFDTLNLSTAVGDAPEAVRENRRRVLEALGTPPLAELRQVHGTHIHAVTGPGTWEGDGLLTQTPGLALRVAVADCYPVLLEDPTQRVVGALHAGWRGVLGGILPQALEAMHGRWGSRVEEVRVAVGPGIQGACYQVGPEVIEHFANAGFPDHVFWPDPHAPGRYRLDLEAALRWQARTAGVRPEHYWSLGACTHCDPRFYSHRRDAGRTGRMWGVIRAW
ncbi:peptidoglycan editing factor PgeF [Marinithermus hydrothermalis]|uniref:Purine nucleoside phosphorylase n=1 Tax=Marinithermus hydrothermalis (strain DSM 14884 / JCM 11576 / T1) TaxID=869210 RepID=F2NPR3_MARHT|nr:peptidoglycan editing factor PgeF [Marinithermus hydrothermalis]AEB12839.1 Multi-copper polyphenol oxidoreductase, laccase [Marinithermus hydrothermalis DSM 14884]